MTRPGGVLAGSPYGADVLFLIRRLHADAGHGRRVASHAETLFAAAAPWIHAKELALGQLLERLVLAAWLHDVGKVVSLEQHHKHSRYILANSESTQHWNADLRADVGALCMVHRRAFRRKWRKKWLRDDPGLLQTAALLRVADALDRSHEPGITVAATMEDDALYVRAHGLRRDDADRLTARKADIFEQAFGRPLILIAEPAGSAARRDRPAASQRP